MGKLSFAFGAGTDTPTQADLERERALVDALLSRGVGQPRNVGEGLTALGAAIGSRMAEGRYNRKAKAASGGASKLFDEFTRMGMAAPATAQPATFTPDKVDPVDHIESGPLSSASVVPGVAGKSLAAALEYANQGAVRKQPVTDKLASLLPEAVTAVYGPGYKVQVFSGGQPSSGPERTGSVRHNDGRAADVYVVGPDGKRLSGDALAPLGQYWAAKKYGGVGMEMHGGGIHLDEWAKPPPGGGMSWNYADKGGNYTPAMQEAMQAGLGGKTPKLYAALGGIQQPEVMPSGAGAPVMQPLNLMPAPQIPQQMAQATQPQMQAPTAQPAVPTPQELLGMINHPSFQHLQPVQQQMIVDAYKQMTTPPDPMKALELEKTQLELQQMRNPKVNPMDALKLEREQLEIEGLRNPKATPADQLAREKFEFEKAQKSADWSKLSDGSLFNERTGEIKSFPVPAPTPDFKDVTTLRKEVQDTQQIKNYNQAAPIYRSMVETAGRNSKASDLNMVYGLGKIMDPTSVVREGEMVMVKNTSSVPDWLQGAIASLNGGSALTPETRLRIMEEARSRMGAYGTEAESIRKQYEGISKRHNLNMDDIWQPLEKLPDYKPVPAEAPEGWQQDEWDVLTPEEKAGVIGK